nr:hypothetical protein [Tanacetum cinerariifolium]
MAYFYVLISSLSCDQSGKVTSDPPKKLKGIPSLTLEEQEATDIMKALKEIVSATSSERTGTKPGVPDEEKDITEENVILEWGSEQENDIYKYKICVRKDEDEEMLNAEVKDSDKGDEEVTDAAKADAEKTSEVKDDAKKTELPPTSSSLSVSLESASNSETTVVMIGASVVIRGVGIDVVVY